MEWGQNYPWESFQLTNLMIPGSRLRFPDRCFLYPLLPRGSGGHGFRPALANSPCIAYRHLFLPFQTNPSQTQTYSVYPESHCNTVEIF